MPASGQNSAAPSSDSIIDTELPHSSKIPKTVSKSVNGSHVSTNIFLPSFRVI